MYGRHGAAVSASPCSNAWRDEVKYDYVMGFNCIALVIKIADRYHAMVQTFDS